MDTLLRLIGFASIPLVVASVFLTIRGLGSEYRVRVGGLVITAAFAIGVLVLFNAVLDVETTVMSWALAIAGVVVGALVGRSTPLRSAGADVFARRTPWAAGVWLAGFGYAQLAVLGAVPGDAEGGLGAMFVATGVAVGTSLALAVRRGQVAKPTGAATAVLGSCAHCGRPNPDAACFCGNCGWRMVRRSERDEVVA